jgi:hypothetical protein
MGNYPYFGIIKQRDLSGIGIEEALFSFSSAVEHSAEAIVCP